MKPVQDLIWFSVPGSIGVLTLGLLFPSVAAIAPAILIASAPMLGFVLHQSYRTLFELTGGWESGDRSVLALIGTEYDVEDERTQFLIWETTFYSEGIPAPFREHNRAAWHYVMSFWSVAFTSFISAVALAITPLIFPQIDAPVPAVIAGFLMTAIFWLKGRQTYASLTRQEVAAFAAHKKAFDAVGESVKRVIPPSQSPRLWERLAVWLRLRKPRTAADVKALPSDSTSNSVPPGEEGATGR
jgi:hypothetical protein